MEPSGALLKGTVSVRVPKRRLAIGVIVLGVVAAWIAAGLGNWQVAIASLAALQAITLLAIVYVESRQQHGLQSQRRENARQQDRLLRQLKETARSLETTDRRLANIDRRLTAAYESTRVDVADIAAHLRRAPERR